PRFYMVPPERYDALLAEVERLKKQLEDKQPAAVTALEVTGKVRGGVAELKAVYKFDAARDRTTVSLGCRQAEPTAVQPDGKLPPVLSTAEGLALEVAGKGEHPATLEMALRLKPLAAAEAARPGAPRAAPADLLEGFELDLPPAPVTNVDLELPEGAKAVE